jgi:putative tricarboxylic transport membrane protein
LLCWSLWWALAAVAEPATPAAGAAECVVPAKAGGGFDLTCKLAQRMLAADKAVRLSYLPGGIGAVAYSTVMTKRPGDPSMLVAFSSGSLLNLVQGKFGPYSEVDARWLAVVGADYGVIAVRKDSPFRSLKDLALALKADPRTVAIGAGGTIGSQDWFKAALLARAAGVSHKLMRFVAFEGGGDALDALDGGHVQVVTGDAAEASQMLEHRAGIRLLAVLSEQRLPGLLASVPTAREQGFDIVWTTARGFYLGPKVSDAAYREWSELFQRAMAAPGFAALRQAHGLYPLSLSGPALQAFVARNMREYGALVEQFQLPRR